MLAAPVSFEGRLEQYVGRLKTYKRTGFSIWTGDVQSKQMINAIYDSGNYIENFAQDIVFVYGSAAVCYELIRKMQQVGIDVVTKSEVEERFAVIDDELVWHGGMNLLGKVDVWDNLMRIKSHQVAAELLEIAGR